VTPRPSARALPTYQQIGIWAPILLVILRFIQGIGLGGEWGGASLMVIEHAPAGQRGLFGSGRRSGWLRLRARSRW
jgi:MFS transporter, MHS family, shikimate and dehydroshikimate transport protein